MMMYRNFLRTLAMVSLCCVMLAPVDVMAKNNKHNTERPAGNHGNRPGASGNNNNRPAVNRPGNNGNNRPGNGPAVNRPGNNGNNRPGNGPAVNRPGNGPIGPQQPGNNGNHNGWNKPGNPHYVAPTRPGTSHLAPPPARPNRPVYAPWSRPVPPPASWRPSHGAPSLGTILGITIGTALANSIDYLTHAGYYVDGYRDGAVYLRDVTQMNLMWPDAVLFYDNGYLAGSEYNYSTPYSSPARYSSVYNSLYGTYGPPVSTVSPSAGVTLSTWYTPGNGYISLQYGPALSAGICRYYTTLRVGRY